MIWRMLKLKQVGEFENETKHLNFIFDLLATLKIELESKPPLSKDA